MTDVTSLAKRWFAASKAIEHHDGPDDAGDWLDFAMRQDAAVKSLVELTEAAAVECMAKGVDSEPLLRLATQVRRDNNCCLRLPSEAIDAAAIVVKRLELAAKAGESPAEQDKRERKRVSAPQLFVGEPPANLTLQRFIIFMDSRAGDDRPTNQIAREFTRGDKNKARSLVNSMNRLARDGRINLKNRASVSA